MTLKTVGDHAVQVSNDRGTLWVHAPEQRRAFWRSFGFDIIAPDRRGEGQLQGVVGRLHLVDGLVLDEQPRILGLSAFNFHQMTL